MKQTKGTRLHIGFFGKRNAGKSSLINNIFGQDLSIVSDTKGTTTDVVEKSMELLPIGPVTLLDTAGIDDIGELGILRVQQTMKALNRCDVIVFVCDYEKLNEIEKDFIETNKENKTPIICVINKQDKGELNEKDFEFLKNSTNGIIKTSKLRKEEFINSFKKELLKVIPDDVINQGKILSDIINEDETCILVIPIDKEAPKGRLILPQVNVIRELLDNNSITLICTPEKLSNTINSMKNPPKLVVVDSQSFKYVSEILDENIPLTSFSILFARLKGDLNILYKGTKGIDELKDNDNVLILESCSHHPIEDDIGRVKIPNLIKKYTNKNLNFSHYAGHDFPKDITKYSLIVHCGGCMTNKKEILNRLQIAENNNVYITNYGMAIAKCIGILDRAIKPIIEN